MEVITGVFGVILICSGLLILLFNKAKMSTLFLVPLLPMFFTSFFTIVILVPRCFGFGCYLTKPFREMALTRWVKHLPLKKDRGFELLWFTAVRLIATLYLMRTYVVLRHCTFRGCSCQSSPRVLVLGGYGACPFHHTHASGKRCKSRRWTARWSFWELYGRKISNPRTKLTAPFTLQLSLKVISWNSTR